MAVASRFVNAVGESFAVIKLFADAFSLVAGRLGLPPDFIGFVDLLLQSNGAGIM
jgi:hypothetical protein